MHAERDILIKKIFPQLRKMCEERAVTWAEVDLRWGITDEQKAEGKVLPLCLQEIQRCRPYFIGLLGERYGSLASDFPPDLLERQPWLERHRDYSITALEIIHGVLRDRDMHGHAYFYFRDPKFLDGVPADKRLDFKEENARSADKLTQLKEAIRRARDERVCELRENYATPEELGEWILEDFTKLIDRLYPKDQTPDPLDQEAARHEAYARSRRLAFIGREDLLRRLSDCAASPTGKPLVLTGQSGCGKSALLAEWSFSWRANHPDDLIIQHYIGSTPDSADWQSLVRRILEELKRAFSIVDDLPTTPDALRDALNAWTTKAAGSRRVVVVLDSLNQLTDDDAAKQLGWLPVGFPSNFCVFISAQSGESMEVLRERGYHIQEVPLFKPEQIPPAVSAFFEPYGHRQLPKETVAALVNSEAALNPLYLRAVLDELRQFGDDAALNAKAAHYLAAPDLPELFDRILLRWHQDFGQDSRSSRPRSPHARPDGLCPLRIVGIGNSRLAGKERRAAAPPPLDTVLPRGRELASLTLGLAHIRSFPSRPGGAETSGLARRSSVAPSTCNLPRYFGEVADSQRPEARRVAVAVAAVARVAALGGIPDVYSRVCPTLRPPAVGISPLLDRFTEAL